MKRFVLFSLGFLLGLGGLPGTAQDKGQAIPKEGLNLTAAIGKDDPKVRIELVPVENKGIELPAKTYLVQFQAGKRYRMEMTSKELDSFLVLQDQAGKQIAFDDDGAGIPNALLYFDAVKGGTYKILAVAFRNLGTFSLAVKEEGDFPVLKVGPGLKLKGQISPKTKSQSYHISMTKDKTYTITMTSANAAALDPFLELFDADGKKLAHDDDSAGYPNARITFLAPAAGTFRIEARSFLGTGNADYTLEVIEK